MPPLRPIHRNFNQEDARIFATFDIFEFFAGLFLYFHLFHSLAARRAIFEFFDPFDIFNPIGVGRID